MVGRSYFEQKLVVPEHRRSQYTASPIGTQVIFLSDAPSWLEEMENIEKLMVLLIVYAS